MFAETAFEGVGDGFRLFENFLFGEVAVLAAIHGVGRGLGHAHRTFDFLAAGVVEGVSGAAQVGDVAFLEIDHVACHRRQRQHVGADEVLLDADADHQRAALARRDQAVRFVAADDPQCIRSLKLIDRGHRRLAQVFAFLQMMMHQVRDHLGVGLGGEFVTQFLQFFPQFFVIFDDAVVHHGDDAVADVRVGIVLARNAVRGPAGMGDRPVWPSVLNC